MKMVLNDKSVLYSVIRGELSEAFSTTFSQ